LNFEISDSFYVFKSDSKSYRIDYYHAKIDKLKAHKIKIPPTVTDLAIFGKCLKYKELWTKLDSANYQ